MKKVLYLLLVISIVSCESKKTENTVKTVKVDSIDPDTEPFKELPAGRNYRTKEEIAARQKYFERQEELEEARLHPGEDSIGKAARKKAEAAWLSTKAGKMYKDNPSWSKEDCEKLADGQVWIGMKYSMLKYVRGTPSSANPSDYGQGVQWQWCWTYQRPSCFYDRDNDGLIDAYN